ITTESYVNAPVLSGQILGKVVLSVDEQEVVTFDITASDEVEKLTFGKAILLLLRRLICL
ncbi:MAG: hypothetical protein RR036_03955, partial [Oscillospiraceae bacterium]